MAPLTPNTGLKSCDLAAHLVCHLHALPPAHTPKVTGSPFSAPEKAEGERGTWKVILSVNALWTSMDASGQSSRDAEQSRNANRCKLTTTNMDKTVGSNCHLLTALMLHGSFMRAEH